VKLAGSDLDGVDQLVFSHEGIKATPEMSDLDGILPEQRHMENEFVVEIAGDVPPGIYEARAVGVFGASNPRAFHVTKLNEVARESKNSDRDSAQVVEPGTIVSGNADGNYHFYKLSLKANEPLLIDCYGERIDSRMDPTLRIYGPAGKELELIRDVAGRDPVRSFTAPADGEYVVAVYDFLHRGGGDYFYRLAFDRSPRVDFVFPPVGEPGKTSKFTFYGSNLPGGQPADGMTIAGHELEKVTVDVAIPGDPHAAAGLEMGDRLPPAASRLSAISYQLDQANPVLIGIAEAPVVVEQDENDTAEAAQQIEVPCDFVGQFYPARDRDWVQFEAKKGEVFWIEVIAHRFALESDPFLLVQRVTKNDNGDEEVSMLAQVDDPDDRNNNMQEAYHHTTDDPSWKLEADQDATYRVMVYDQFNSSRDDPRYAYRLIIRKKAGDFSLTARPPQKATNNNNQIEVGSHTLRRGGTTAIELDIDRHAGFDGEIEVSVEGLPDGVSCAGAVAGGENKIVPLVIAAADNANAWAGPIRIIGKAKVDGQEIVREARTAVFVWGTNNIQQERPDARLSRDVMLSVIDKEMSPVSVTAEDKMWETALGGELEFPVKLAKHGEIKGDVKLQARGLPGELKINDFNVKGGEGDAVGKLEVNNNNTKPGTYTFYFRATGKYAYERYPESVKQAEQYQSMLGDTVKRLDEELKKADEAANQAGEALKKAQEELKNAEDGQKEAKQKAVDEREEAKKKADEAKKLAEDRKKRAEDLKKQADSDLKNIKNAAKKKDVNFEVASAPIKVRIAREPFVIKEVSPVKVKQDGKAEITIKIERLFGYDEEVEVNFEGPDGVGGLSVKNAKIEKGQSEVKLELEAAGNANPGDHTAKIRFRHKNGNIRLDTREEFPLSIEEVKSE